MPKRSRRHKSAKKPLRIWQKGIKLVGFLLLTSVVLAACAVKPQPNNIDNICEVFRQYPEWYWAAQKSEKEWGIPVHVQMAFVHQESSFRAGVKPERTKLLGFIPWKRPSTAKGYSQALSPTWNCYKEKTGNAWASRTSFGDAVHFIGWYSTQAHTRAGIPKHDAHNLYLAYHEGIGGYQRAAHNNKPWLLDVARKVHSRSAVYQQQLARCEATLKKKPWYRFW